MKTGALLGAAMAAGAVLAGAPRAIAQRFDAAGRLLGLAFQVRDDWLGTWGDPAGHRQGPERRPAPAQAHLPGGRRLRGRDARRGVASCAGSSANASPAASSVCARCSMSWAVPH